MLPNVTRDVRTSRLVTGGVALAVVLAGIGTAAGEVDRAEAAAESPATSVVQTSGNFVEARSAILTWTTPNRYRVPAPVPARAQGRSPRATKSPAASRSKVRAPVVPRTRARTAKRVSASKTSIKAMARGMLPKFGWSVSQFACVDSVFNRESAWNPTATNRSSGAYGLPQALPGSKMASAGPDWRTNPQTQIRWAYHYMGSRYGSPCGAKSFWDAHGWY